MRPGVMLAVAAGLALSGCGDVSPGAAATVDGTTISLDRVDELARSVCTAEVTYAGLNKQDWEPTPAAVYRDNALTLLVNEQLALDVGEQLDVDVPPSSYELGGNAQLSALLEAMPAADLEPFQQYLDSYNRLQALYAGIGRQAAKSPDIDIQTATADGQAYVADYADGRDIDLDPRFGNFTAGQVVGGSGSLSVPVDEAGAAVPTSPDDPPNVSALPESQICQ